MKKVIFIAVFTLIHASISYGLFMLSLMIGIGRWDTGRSAGGVEICIALIYTLLTWPIYHYAVYWVSRLSSGSFYGLPVIIYLLYLLNSFIWGLATWWLYSRHNAARERRRNGSCRD